jgi:hypothetical protein
MEDLMPSPAPTSVFEVIARIVLKGLEIFGDERKRHFASQWQDVLTALQNARNLKFPYYTDAGIVLAQERMDAFYLAFEAEHSAAVDEMIKKVRA